MKKSLSRLLALSVIGLAAGCAPFLWLFPQFDPEASSWVLKWNRIAIDASGLDHMAVQPGESRTFGHQLGPTRSSRATAIVHIAMFEAINAITGGYKSYTGMPRAEMSVSMKVAVAQAAHDTLVALYPSHAPTFDAKLAEDLASVTDATASQNGVTLGQAAAQAILQMRAADGSDNTVAYVFSNDPGKWRVDPLNPGQSPLGEEWPQVTPFALSSASQFRAPAPPSIDSAEYAVAYDEVKQIGGDGVITPTSRTEDQTQTGIFWAYDGTPSLCAPPRLYNQIAAQLAVEQGLDVVQLARLLALVNVAMATPASAYGKPSSTITIGDLLPGYASPIRARGPAVLGTETQRRSETRPIHPLAPRRATSRGRTSRRLSRLIHRGTRGSAVRCSRRCATSSAVTTSPLRLSPTNSTV